MSHFNLIHEKWIPVRYLNGTRGELGIRDTLLQLKEIAGIEDPSPLVVAALHRFLLAILYRALEGPTDRNEAIALFKNGLPAEKVTGYLDKWRNRFWLFDGKYPFYQVPGYEPKDEKGKEKWRPWLALAAEHNADNAKVLFDHMEISQAGMIPSGKAARLLIACQTFALGGGNSDFQYTKSGPSATAAMVIPLGMDLFDTLTFSLVPQNREIFQNDIPIWEREPESLSSLQKGIERTVLGWADLYSWRTRSIKLNLHQGGLAMGELLFASGVACSSKDYIDPMFAYKINEKKGIVPIHFRERGLWRDFDSLLPHGSDPAPLVIEHATALGRSNRKRFPRSIIVLGQSNNKAKIEYWRMERFTLPEALLEDQTIRIKIRELLEEAEKAQRALWMACRSYARYLLSRGDRVPTGRDISALVEQMPATSWYWSSLETRFHEILLNYTLGSDPDNIRYQWLKSIRNILSAAWEQHAASASIGNAWAIRALVNSEGFVLGKIKELNETIKKLEPNLYSTKEVA